MSAISDSCFGTHDAASVHVMVSVGRTARDCDGGSGRQPRMRRIAALLSISAALLVLPGCGLLEFVTLPAAPKDNIATEAITTRPLDPAFRVVLRSDFERLSRDLDRGNQATTPEVLRVLETNADANNAWTSGVVAEGFSLAGTVTGSSWVVADDLSVASHGSTFKLLASTYQLVSARLTFSNVLVGDRLSFTIKPTAIGYGRCCGPEMLCDTGPLGPSGGCPDGLCGNIEFTPYSGAEVPRLTLGLPNIRASSFTYPFGFRSTQCHSSKLCENVTPMCSGSLDIDFSHTWDVSIPNGSGGGSCSAGDRPVSGRDVPAVCTYANVHGAGFGMSAGSMPAECDGRCIGCEADARGASQSESAIRARQCSLISPVPGSGVCQGTPTSVQLEQAAMRAEAGVPFGQSGKGSCTIGNAGVRSCLVCTPTTCHRVIDRLPLYADAPQGCGATQEDACSDQSAAMPTPAAEPDQQVVWEPLPYKFDAVQVDQTTPPPPPQVALEANVPRTTQPATDTQEPNSITVGISKALQADPVSLGDGALEIRKTDLAFEGSDRPLAFTRLYNSRSRGRSELGSNWTHNWDIRLIALNDSNRPTWADPFCSGAPGALTCLLLHTPEADRLFSYDVVNDIFVPQAGLTATLRSRPDGAGWFLLSADGHLMVFDASGYLVEDRDRFGNGFLLEWEFNAAGALFDALCPVDLAVLNGQAGNYDVPVKPGGLSAMSLECALLGGLVGQRAPYPYSPGNGTVFAPVVPDPLGDARDLIILQQGAEGRKAGAAAPWGQRAKRLRKVSEIQTRDAVGNIVSTWRSLTFNYWPDTDRTPVDGSSVLPHAGLLRSIDGPAGAHVDFDYGTPESLGHPAWLNEVMVTRVTRADGPTGVDGLAPTPRRVETIQYAWNRNVPLTAQIVEAGKRYEAYLRAQTNCGYHTVNSCGQVQSPGFQFTDIPAAIASYTGNLLSDAVDNIVRIDNDGVIESETRYDMDVFSNNYDRVAKQRYGSSVAVAPPVEPGDFDSLLPEARLSYVAAGPVHDGEDDATSAFLDAALAARYPLEPVAADVIQSARAKGALVEVLALPYDIPHRLVAIAEGELFPQRTVTYPACQLAVLPFLKNRLAGYRPSFEYFPRPVPARRPEAVTWTDGVDPDASLLRSRLSCETLANAQTYNVATSDLHSTWGLDGTTMIATPLRGRRAMANADANRICSWTKLVDRDGDLHVFGLNFQGRQLVQGVLVDSVWRLTENLFNADGNVISRRAVTPGSDPWTPTAGDILSEYVDITADGKEILPASWMRRANVVRTVERPSGGSVRELADDSGSTFLSAGRYVDYQYEPIFNQLMSVEAGSLDVAGQKRVTRRSLAVFDYQEDSMERLLPVLRWQKTFGYRYPLDAAGDIDTRALATSLAVRFGLGDVNGDGLLAATVTGLPSEVRVSGTRITSESTFYRWAPSGRPNTVINPDGRIARFDYYPVGMSSGTSPQHGGALARIRQTDRASWPASEGPPRAPCPFLLGPWQWLLPDSCNAASLSTQLQLTLHLPARVAARIVESSTPSSAGDVEFDYFANGSLRAVRGPRTKVVRFERDLDGRTLAERVFDGGAPFASRVVEYDPAMRPRLETSFDDDGLALGAVHREFDEEGHVLYECEAFSPNGCDHGERRGALPADGRSVTTWLTAEGNVATSQDAEGMATSFVLDARKWPRTVTVAAPNGQTRVTRLSHDDAGRNLTRSRGAAGEEQLSETSTFDGYGRIATVADTHGRVTRMTHSWRGQVALVEELGADTTVLRTQSYEVDEFARPVAHSLNGVELARVFRGKGGIQFARTELGRRKVYSAANAEGETAWTEDEGSEITMLRVGNSGTDASAASLVRRAGSDRVSTSVVNTVDIAGSVLTSTSIGDSRGSGRPLAERTTTFERRPDGLARKVVAPNLSSVEKGYDLGGRLRWVIRRRSGGDSAAESTSFDYDRMNRQIRVVDPKSETTQVSYTSFGELKSVTTPGGAGVVSMQSYDVLGRPSDYGIGIGRLHYQYGANNEVENLWSAVGEGDQPWSQADAAHGLWLLERHFTFDGLGRLREATNFNPAMRLSAVSVPSASRVVTTILGYDRLGRVASETVVNAATGAATTASTRSDWIDSAGVSSMVRHVTRPDGIAVDEYVDSLGRLTRSARQVDGRSTASNLSYIGELPAKIRSDKAGSPMTVSIARDMFGRESGRSAALTDVDTAGIPLYPAEGQVVCSPWTTTCARPIIMLDIGRDEDGRIATSARTDTVPTLQAKSSQWRGYLYDGFGRLSNALESAALPPAPQPPGDAVTADQVSALGAALGADDWTYSRESVVGTLRSISSTTGTPSPRFAAPAIEPGYRVGSYAGPDGAPRALGYDRLGRVEADGETRYRWDAFSALSSIDRAGAPTNALQYDGLGRLVARWSDGLLQSSLRYDGLQMISAKDAQGGTQWSAFWGSGVDDLLAVRVAGEELLPVHDQGGNALAWVRGRDAKVVAGASFTPEGRATVWSIDGNGNRVDTCTDGVDVSICPRPLGTPFDFQSAFREPASGLLHFRNRWYSPTLTSWLSLDARGASESPNGYAFESFDPVNRRDPMGLESNMPGPGASEEEWERYARFLNSDVIVVTAPEEDSPPANSLYANGYIGDFISIPVMHSATPMSTNSPGASLPGKPSQPRYGSINVGGMFAQLDPLMLELVLSGELGVPKERWSGEFSKEAVATALGEIGSRTNLDGTAEVMENLALWHIRLDHDYAAAVGTLPVQPRTTQDTAIKLMDRQTEVIQFWGNWGTVAAAMGTVAWGNTSRAVFNSSGKLSGTVEQYALRAKKPGYFPVMQRGQSGPVAWQYLEEGEVWKFGTTRNPFGRYTQLFLDRLRSWNLRNLPEGFERGSLEYWTEFSGTDVQARTQESLRILEYLEENFHLPPGNKIVK